MKRKRILVSLYILLISSWISFDLFAVDVGIGLGMNNAGTYFGLDVTHKPTSKYGFGGHLKMMGKEEEKGQPGLTILGGSMRPVLKAGPIDLYGIAGLDLIMIDPIGSQADKETAFGPMIGYGIGYRFTPIIALGLEYSLTTAWTGKDAKGMFFNFMMLVFHATIN